MANILGGRKNIVFDEVQGNITDFGINDIVSDPMITTNITATPTQMMDIEGLYKRLEMEKAASRKQWYTKQRVKQIQPDESTKRADEARTPEQVSQSEPTDPIDPNRGSCKGPVQVCKRINVTEFITRNTIFTPSKAF